MQQFFARLILFLTGHFKLAAARIGEVRWTFSTGGATVLAIGTILALIVVVIVYRRTTEGLTPRARIVLGTLRLVSLLILLLMVSGAAVAVDVASRELPRMLVLVDDSPSMALPSGDTARVAAAQHALSEDGLLARLRKTYDVHVATTSGRDLGAADEAAVPQNLAASLVRESTRGGDRAISQILLLSDGAQLGSTELAQAAAELPAPVNTLAVGDGDVHDVILQNVTVPPYVYLNDRALIAAEVRSLGINGEANLQLYQLTGTAETQVSDAHVTLKAGDEPATARLQFVASAAGIQRYKLRVLPVSGELTPKNNEIVFHLDVRPDKIRVLFVEGSPSWEYKFVKEAMEKDPAVDFYGMVRLPGDEWLYQGKATRPDGKPVIASPKGGFPANADELNFFDVLILGDLERKMFEQGGRYDLIDAFVKNRAGGMATIGGLQVYGAGDYAGTPLARILPFEIEKEKKQQLINHYVAQLTTQGLMHPAMQLEFDPTLNAQTWAKLPWVEGGNAIRQVKPAATTLLIHPSLKTTSGPRPIAAAWQYGAGRVLSSAMDGTWHWRTARESDVDYHARYWALMTRWLSSDPRSGKSAGTLMLDDAVMEVAKPATVSLAMREKTGAPILDATSDFTIIAPSGKTIYARSSSDSAVPGRYAVTFVPSEPGEYIVRSATARQTEQPVKQEQKYLVGPSRSEYVDPRPDAKALVDLSAATGGTSTALANHAQFVVPQATQATQVQHILVPLWHSAGLLILLVVTLTTEWLMRKRRGLS